MGSFRSPLILQLGKLLRFSRLSPSPLSRFLFSLFLSFSLLFSLRLLELGSTTHIERNTYGAAHGLLQMTLTASEKVILQLIEQHHIFRQSLPFDTRRGAKLLLDGGSPVVINASHLSSPFRSTHEICKSATARISAIITLVFDNLETIYGLQNFTEMENRKFRIFI